RDDLVTGVQTCALPIFVDGGGAEVLTRVAVFARAAVVTNVVIGDDEMRRLVLFVMGRGVVHVRELVEGETAIRLRHFAGLAVKRSEERRVGRGARSRE